MTAHAEGTFTVASWEEDTFQDLAGQEEKLTKARMGFQLSGDLAGDLVSDTFMYYREDGTAEYTGLQRFTGQIAGRSGTCVISSAVSLTLNGDVTHWVVDQGTGDLAGLHGQGTFPFDAIEHGPGCPGSGFDCVDCPPATGTCDDSFDLNYTGQIDFAP